MTTHKGFKRVVRSRMARTGERYAVARRALLRETADRAPHPGATPEPGPAESAYVPRGGHFPNASAVAGILANRGFVAGHDGRPLGEALILGIAGGLGAGYILWEFKAADGPILTLGFTNQWQYPAIPGWFGKTLDRLGIPAELHETAGAQGARRTLDAILETGEAVVTFVDEQEIGTWGQPDSLSGHSGYPVVTYDRSDDAYLVDDRGRAPLVVPADVMARARGRIPSYRHRLIRMRPASSSIGPVQLRAAVEAGLADQLEHLSSPSDSFSLPAWRKWSRLMTDTRNAKSWPRVFAGGRGLFGALLSIVELVDGDVGAEGGHLRELYADFLDEAAEILGKPALAEAANGWRAVGDLWDDFADAAVPDDIPELGHAVDAGEALHAAAMAGEPGRPAVREAAQRLWTARRRFADAFPASPDRVENLLADLGLRLATIFEAECDALARTAAAARAR